MASVILTPRLRLVPVARGDTDHICALLWHPQVRCHLCDNQLLPRNHVEGWIADSLETGSLTSFWRMEASAGDFIGLIGLKPQSPDTLKLRAIGWRSLDVTVALHPAYWGKGLASQALNAISDYALGEAITFAIVATVDEPNVRSHRLFQRCGFNILGQIPGSLYPLIVYERAL